jgi:hypothetical protein
MSGANSYLYRFDALFRQLSGMAGQIQQFASTAQGNDASQAFALGKRQIEKGEHVCGAV